MHCAATDIIIRTVSVICCIHFNFIGICHPYIIVRLFFVAHVSSSCLPSDSPKVVGTAPESHGGENYQQSRHTSCAEPRNPLHPRLPLFGLRRSVDTPHHASWKMVEISFGHLEGTMPLIGLSHIKSSHKSFTGNEAAPPACHKDRATSRPQCFVWCFDTGGRQRFNPPLRKTFRFFSLPNDTML